MGATLVRGLGRGQGGVPPSPSYRCALPACRRQLLPPGHAGPFVGAASAALGAAQSVAANEDQQAPLGQQRHRLDLRPQLLAFVQTELVA